METKEKELRKIIELNKSGYAGVTPNGKIVDRRKVFNAQPIPENKSMGIPKPRQICVDHAMAVDKLQKMEYELVQLIAKTSDAKLMDSFSAWTDQRALCNEFFLKILDENITEQVIGRDEHKL